MIKRLFDLILAIVGLIVMVPLYLLLIWLVYRKIGTPIFFKQTRPGLLGQPFRMYKFHTMNDARDDAGNLLSDAERLTTFGCFLRSYSLDELPELWNVVRGDMSLVGPRPLLIEYLPLYSEDQMRRHDVRPGITGWTQVNGRNALSWEEKFKLDTWYVENKNIMLDLKIMLQTIKKVLAREGISAEGEATMSRFKGTVNT